MRSLHQAEDFRSAENARISADVLFEQVGAATKQSKIFSSALMDVLTAFQVWLIIVLALMNFGLALADHPDWFQ